MFLSTLFTVCPDEQEWLQAAGLLDFDALMRLDLGEEISKDYKRQTVKINIANRTLFLKRRNQTAFQEALETYLCGRRAHSVPYNEYLQVQALRAKQLPVMKALAAGEIRQWGFPGAGFVLLEGVAGDSFDIALSNARHLGDERQVDALLTAFGELLAHFHNQGFYSALRFKDVIVKHPAPLELVMIDREVRNPNPRRYRQWRVRRSLRQSFERIDRDFSEFNANQQHRIMNAYNKFANHQTAFDFFTQ